MDHQVGSMDVQAASSSTLPKDGERICKNKFPSCWFDFLVFLGGLPRAVRVRSAKNSKKCNLSNKYKINSFWQGTPRAVRVRSACGPQKLQNVITKNTKKYKNTNTNNPSP